MPPPLPWALLPEMVQLFSVSMLDWLDIPPPSTMVPL